MDQALKQTTLCQLKKKKRKLNNNFSGIFWTGDI